MTASNPNVRRSRTVIMSTLLVMAVALLYAMTLTLPQTGRAESLAGPDLTVEINLHPPAPAVGEEVTIEFVVRNLGDATATGPVSLHLYIDPPVQPPETTTAPSYAFTSTVGLPAGGHFSLSRTHTFSEKGCNHVIYGWVDRSNRVAESNEENNLVALPVCVGVECVPDPYEEDNLCSAAGLIAENASQARSFCHAQNQTLADEDWVKFTAFAGVTYTLATSNAGVHAAPEVELYSACSALTPLTSGADQVTWHAPGSGVLYARLANEGGVIGPLSAYSLTLSSATGVSDPFEPDNRCADARDILTDGTRQSRLFQAPGDEDWVKFSVKAGESFIIVADNSGPGVNPLVTLFASCSQVAANHSLAPAAAQVAQSSLTDSLYFARLTNQNPNRFGADARYDLAVTAAACTPDADEDDDDRSQARTVTVGDPARTHNVCPASDEDWVRFSAVQGKVYVLQTLNLAFAADTVLHLYHTDGTTELAQNDDYGYTSGSRIVWEAPADGVYYAKVRHANPVASGPNTQYDLLIQEGVCAPDAQEGSEGDNGPGDATVMPAGGVTQTHTFCADPLNPALGDQDWLRFSAVANGNYVIETADLGPNSDTVLELFGPDGRTRLRMNDDSGPGRSAVLNFTAPAGGDYFVRVTQFNPNITGGETEYQIRMVVNEPPTPTPIPSPTPTPFPTPTPSPTPNMADVKSLILVNRSRFEALYGAVETAALMDKVAALAGQEAVQGVVVPVEQDGSVAAAYTAWTANENTLADNARANAVAAAVRNTAMSFLAGAPNVRYIVIVGDDRIIPFRRVLDQVQPGSVGASATGVLEEEYVSEVGTNTTVAAALAANMVLTDDFYGDREPGEWKDRQGNTYPLYLSDYAISRLVETPGEIRGMIDQFLSNRVINTNNVLVTGYDFVQDGADSIQKQFKNDGLATNSTLVGPFWSGSALRSLHLNASPRFDIHSINGHSTHTAAGVPDKNDIRASEIVTAPTDLAGALVFSVGCHGGLNDPAVLDLPQAFMQRRAYYIGNTGFGWGGSGVVMSEKLMTLFARELVRDARAEIGPALRNAKQKYLTTEQIFDAFDAKVLMQVTFYGLPMVEVTSGPTLDSDRPFPSAETTFTPPSAFGGLNQGAVGYNLPGSVGAFGDNSTSMGRMLDLDGNISFSSGAPVQPLFYAEVAAPAAGELRGVLFLGGAYRDQPDFDPVIGQPDNEYVEILQEPALTASGWVPELPFAIRTSEALSRTGDTVVMSLGQFSAAEGSAPVERVYTQMSFGTYYSQSPDRNAADIEFVDAILNPATGTATVKVETFDASGIHRVVVAYTADDGAWASKDLTFDTTAQKWTGIITATVHTRYFVQVVDKAGNVAANTNKGRYYPVLPPPELASGRGLDNERRVFLPVVKR